MDTGDIFEKKAKGTEEIEKRAFHIDFRHRIALIQVDGKQTVEVLLSKIPGRWICVDREIVARWFHFPRGRAGGCRWRITGRYQYRR